MRGVPKITAVLPALSLLTLTLLASCGTSVLPQPARVPITSVNLTVSPVTGWTPTTETILLSAYGSGVPHLVGQGTLAAGKATLTLPGEAALGAALYTVDTTAANPGCTITRPSSGTGYSVPSFKTATLSIAAKTTSSTTGFRVLQDADLNGPASFVLYVDRDVKVQNSGSCAGTGRTDVTTLDFDLVKGWNFGTRTESVDGTVYTHTFRSSPSGSASVDLNLVGINEISEPKP